jgi:predicted transcriptional regulator
MPTNIMIKANLSWFALQEYLGKLVARGLVQFEVNNEGKKEYCLSSEGFRLLDLLGKI